jgi:translocation and assembly module TamB
VLTGAPPSDTPIAFDLRADGLGGRATIEGFVSQGDLRADIRRSEVRLDDRVLTVEPLVIDALDGRTTLHGFADLRDPNDRKLRFAINARGCAGAARRTRRRSSATAISASRANPSMGRDRPRDVGARGSQGAARFDARGDTAHATIRALKAACRAARWMRRATSRGRRRSPGTPTQRSRASIRLLRARLAGRIEGRIATQGARVRKARGCAFRCARAARHLAQPPARCAGEGAIARRGDRRRRRVEPRRQPCNREGPHRCGCSTSMRASSRCVSTICCPVPVACCAAPRR